MAAVQYFVSETRPALVSVMAHVPIFSDLSDPELKFLSDRTVNCDNNGGGFFMKTTMNILIAIVTTLTAWTAASDTLGMRDGTIQNRTFVSATTATITFREGKILHRYPRPKVQSLQ